MREPDHDAVDLAVVMLRCTLRSLGGGRVVVSSADLRVWHRDLDVRPVDEVADHLKHDGLQADIESANGYAYPENRWP